jgi:hypothetical protein
VFRHTVLHEHCRVAVRRKMDPSAEQLTTRPVVLPVFNLKLSERVAIKYVQECDALPNDSLAGQHEHRVPQRRRRLRCVLACSFRHDGRGTWSWLELGG